MTKIYLFKNIVIVSAIIVICAILESDCIISDKRLCYDEKCNEPISYARTLLRYHSIEPHILSFPTNTEVIIFSKEAGRRQDLWGAQVHGKRGYVPKTMVREYRTLHSKLTYEVPTEFVEQEMNTTDKPKVEKKISLKSKNIDPISNNTVNEPETPDDVEVEEVKDNSQASENPENTGQRTSIKNTPTAEDSPESGAKHSDQLKAETISEGIGNVTPSLEVIDGTTIALVEEDVAIKPTYSTPVTAATVTADQEPILSVHPKLNSNTRPLISRFSNADSTTIVQKQAKPEPNSVAENQTGETDSGEKSSPKEDSINKSEFREPGIVKESKTSDLGENSSEDSINKSEIKELGIVEESNTRDAGVKSLPKEDPVDKSEIKESGIIEESNTTDNLKAKIHINTSLDDNAKFSKIEKPGDESIENDEKIQNSEENYQNDEPKFSDDPANAFVAAIPSEELNPVKNVTNNLKQKTVFSEKDESDGDISKTQLDSNEGDAGEKNSEEIEADFLANVSTLEGTMPEEKFQDSREQTEYLSDQNVTNFNNEADDKNELIKNAVIEEIKIPLTSETVHQQDDQEVQNDPVPDINGYIIVPNVDEPQVDSGNGDDSQSEPEEEEEASHENVESIPNSSETATELYPNFEDDKLTTVRSLLTVDEGSPDNDDQSSTEAFDNIQPDGLETHVFEEYQNYAYEEGESSTETPQLEAADKPLQINSFYQNSNEQEAPQEVCHTGSDCADLDNAETSSPNEEEEVEEDEESYSSGFDRHNYLETFLYVSITAFTTLLFSLGYYYIENHRRDKELVAKINLLEKELLLTTKESMMLGEGLKATKSKLNSIEDESFGSNEMVVSLKAELEAAQMTKGELEDQIISLEKELESATEAGLELERMLREFLASQSDENPLAQSVEDLQTRLNAQQATNESLTNSLNLKSQENEALTSELAVVQERCQQLEVEVTRLSGELRTQNNLRTNAEIEFSTKITHLNKQVDKLSMDRGSLIAQLTAKEMALNDLSEVMKQQSTNNLDFDKLYDVSHIKAEAELVTKERDELKIKLTEVEGAHQLLEEHMKLIKEEIASVTEQYELAERDKTEAQTRLEVLSNYFKEKESQLQKELGMQEAMWVQKQGEVTSTVDRIQTMQNEIQNYRQQIETLKREILDQEREYKSQIAALETKSHEQWVIARQSERRLEESKAEASQLRNRLTMVEKSINEVDSDSKLHRLETNGETASSPQLFMGGESSSSPIIFSGSSGAPPLPPSYMYGGPLPPPFIPPPPHSGGGPMYDISRRPPPLGGRLSSPPPLRGRLSSPPPIPPLHHPPGRYDDANSPPPLSPPLHPPYNHRSPPPFSNERIHPHPPPPFLPPLGTSHSWGDEPLPPLRNPAFHPHQRDQQRIRNHKGSLHSSGDSLDKTNHTGKS